MATNQKRANVIRLFRAAGHVFQTQILPMAKGTGLGPGPWAGPMWPAGHGPLGSAPQLINNKTYSFHPALPQEVRGLNGCAAAPALGHRIYILGPGCQVLGAWHLAIAWYLAPCNCRIELHWFHFGLGFATLALSGQQPARLLQGNEACKSQIAAGRWDYMGFEAAKGQDHSNCKNACCKHIPCSLGTH